MRASHATSIIAIFLPYQQLYSAFSIQKKRVVDLLSIKYVKRTSKHLSHGINVVQRQRSGENYFSKLHQNVISIERMLAPSHCLCSSFFSFIRSLLVSESKARGLARRRSHSRRPRRCRAVIVIVVLSFECHNDTHSSHIIARTTHCFASLLPVPRAPLSS